MSANGIMKSENNRLSAINNPQIHPHTTLSITTAAGRHGCSFTIDGSGKRYALLSQRHTAITETLYIYEDVLMNLCYSTAFQPQLNVNINTQQQTALRPCNLC